jgi:hypothetical protein
MMSLMVVPEPVGISEGLSCSAAGALFCDTRMCFESFIVDLRNRGYLKSVAAP